MVGKLFLLNFTVLFFLVVSFLIGTVFFSTLNIIAQQNNSYLSNEKISGVVLKNNDNQITIQSDQGIQEFNIPNNIRITKNGIQSDINNIKPNDRIIFTLDNNGNLLSVDSITGIIFDIGRWFLPLASILLVLLGVTLLANSKSRRGHFKTKIITS